MEFSYIIMNYIFYLCHSLNLFKMLSYSNFNFFLKLSWLCLMGCGLRKAILWSLKMEMLRHRGSSATQGHKLFSSLWGYPPALLLEHQFWRMKEGSPESTAGYTVTPDAFESLWFLVIMFASITTTWSTVHLPGEISNWAHDISSR